MNNARSSQTLDLTWAASLAVQEHSEQDQLRWFAADGPAYFAAVLAFALGTACWREHALAMVMFAGILASAAYWRGVLACSMQERDSACPRLWSAALRRSTYLTAVLWAALGCWAALAHLPLAAHFIYLLLTAALATSASRGLASDFSFARRYLLILLAPAVATQVIAGRFGSFPEGYGLAAVTLLFSIFMVVRVSQLNGIYWETVTSRARLETQSEKLEQARLTAENSQRIENRLLAKISSEAEAPLMGVARMTALLLETPLTEEQHEYLEIVRDSTAMLLHSMNNLRYFSSPEAGELSLTAEPFEPRSVLQGIAAMFQPKAAAKGLELRVNPGPGLTSALAGDSQRIGQALGNLVANAIQFTEQGHVEIFAACQAGFQKAELLFEVRDTGIGIPAEKLATLFQPLSREASGLGLRIADALAAQMGGRVSVESKAGQGSTFRLSLLLPYALESDKSQIKNQKVKIKNEEAVCLV